MNGNGSDLARSFTEDGLLYEEPFLIVPNEMQAAFQQAMEKDLLAEMIGAANPPPTTFNLENDDEQETS